MATLCEIRQEIRDMLQKHNAQLIVQHPEDTPDEACWVEIRVQDSNLIGSTALY